MKKTLAVAAFAFALIGCQDAATVTTPSPTTQNNEKGIHIHTPGADVDIQRKDKNGKVDVDVHTK
jgi:hypothetical protein